MLQELKDKIIKAVPEIKTRERIWDEYAADFIGVPDSITLEDVMMALPEDKILKITSNKKAVIFLKRILLEGGYLEHSECKWLLGKPLHLQSEETIKSLNALI